MSRTPNYVTTMDHHFTVDKYNNETLKAGSFVRPIELPYVPQHVIEDKRWEWFNAKTEVFCYCRRGIIPLPRHILRET